VTKSGGRESDVLRPEQRAEDIILGSLGFGEEARILSIEMISKEGFVGVGTWPDGEQFKFESDFELSELDRWALDVLIASQSPKGK
jgi:hypothetical protein